MYLGAKHMVTGYDHLAFLAGVHLLPLPLPRRRALRDPVRSRGTASPCWSACSAAIHANPFLIDAIVGLSVAYKAFENLGGFRALGGQDRHAGGRARVRAPCSTASAWRPSCSRWRSRAAGSSATSSPSTVGVELGQFAALAIILLSFNLWRASGRFQSHGYAANAALMTVGFLLVAYQLTGYYLA